jgi:hypothetical protein
MLFVYVVINIALMDLFILSWSVTTHNFGPCIKYLHFKSLYDLHACMKFNLLTLRPTKYLPTKENFN